MEDFDEEDYERSGYEDNPNDRERYGIKQTLDNLQKEFK